MAKNSPHAAPPDALPVLPLRDVVVYPHMVIPLFVGRDKSMRALERAMEGERQILLVAQKSPDIDDPDIADLHQVGTLAGVLQLLKLPDGTVKVLVEGQSRVAVDAFAEEDGMLMARSRVIEPVYNAKERELDVVSHTLVSLFEQLVKQSRKLPPEVLASLSGIDDPSRVADSIAAHLSVRMADKQKVLETADVGKRLELLIGLVDGEMDLQQVEKRIRGRVKSQMEK
ncbi:MAG: LON peptidase substrate-binding domain-containing protein, partial [Pseudomonadota bacterium]|nr:LON peptidase substrate-binding domain-containing protein [Pseudomonadota bacterium]